MCRRVNHVEHSKVLFKREKNDSIEWEQNTGKIFNISLGRVKKNVFANLVREILWYIIKKN